MQFYKGLLIGALLGVVLLGLTGILIQSTAVSGAVSAAAVPSDTPRPAPIPATVEPRAVVLPSASARPPVGTPVPPTWTPTPPPTAAPPVQTLVLPSPTPDCRQEPGRIERGTFYSAVIGRTQPYRVYLPPCYRADGPPLPVVYMLHGSIQNDSHWDDDGLDEAATAAIHAGQAAPFVIAMPAGDLDGTYNHTSGGPGSFEQVMLEEFIPMIQQVYNVRSDRGGRAIGGLSRGAVWALEIAFRHPDLFISVGGHSNAVSVALAPPPYDPLVLAAQAPGIEQLRIYLDAGEYDWYREGGVQLDAILTQRGIPHTYIVNPGTHDDAYWQAHVAEYVAFYAAPWSASSREPTTPEAP
jgi:enterochelin esterase-like enzyme